MTKKEALQKIEELKKYVKECDEKQLQHGDVVCVKDDLRYRRIVVDVNKIDCLDLEEDYLLLDSEGFITNRSSEVTALYTKIRNVFKD